MSFTVIFFTSLQINKIVFAVLTVVVLTASYAQAQITFGTRAGFNFTDVNGENMPDTKMKPGFQLGVTVDCALLKNYLAMKAETSSTTNINYIQVPLNAQYELDLGGMWLLLQATLTSVSRLAGKSSIEEPLAKIS